MISYQHSVSSRTPVTIFIITSKGYKEICTDRACEISRHIVAPHLYHTIRKIQQFFLQNFGLDGIDGKGGMVPVVINWDQKNAEWNCNIGRFCVLRFHNLYALKPEIVAHEYTHAVFANLNPLEYWGQSGALDESIADVMGVFFKSCLTDRLDWRIGELRDLRRPASMHGFKRILEDDGGVHTNSAIPNYAFYQAVLRTRAIDKVARVWFHSFLRVSKTASFEEFASMTVKVAQNMFKGEVATAILKAWQQVKVLREEVPKIEIPWDRIQTVAFFHEREGLMHYYPS